ncbi:MAG: UDP-N-acetylmuramate dehydrogenase [Acidimicrobiia bacterium]
MTTLSDLVSEGILSEGVSLAPLTTYRVGGPCRFFGLIENSSDLVSVARALREDPVPVLVLGRGSNVVVSDRGWNGLVIRLSGDYNEAHFEDDGRLKVGGAMPLPAVARLAARLGRGGLEFLVGIPGSMGGAVHQNAGCHGSEIIDVLVTAEILDLRSGATDSRSARELDLAYRHSNLTPSEVVTEATLRTVPSSRKDAEAIMRDISRWRRENQPGGTHNAGSVFKNPEEDAAGRIIDQLGLKGFRVGGVAVSERHANFFVADEGASAQEIHDLVMAVQEKVLAATGIRLTPEIRFVGEFEETGA